MTPSCGLAAPDHAIYSYFQILIFQPFNLFYSIMSTLTYELYRASTIGTALTDTLDEFITNGKFEDLLFSDLY